MDNLMNEIKVSLILPSLNVGQYIEDCLESAINQTLQEIEIICVDAGSMDGTLEIIEEYTKKDSRIQLIKSDMKSYGHQMNLGIDAASGEYIGILETDDVVPPEMYKELYEVAFRNRAELVKADFYRFTGSGEDMKKDLIRVTGKKSDRYNKIIDISQHKECFNFVMNTWSGIYSRDFLLKNNIWHHETPGASFQDNGFWFQTFMRATRAYFVNKAYYMNRRDRADSSVFNSRNIYAICEEYDWIEEKIKSVPEDYAEYGPLHAYFSFRNYKWTLDRIMFADKAEFYHKMRSKFAAYFKAGMIDYSIFWKFNENLAISLWTMLNQPEEYYSEFYEKKKRIIEEIPEDRTVIIYGAGKVGRDCLDDFIKLGKNAQVGCFAVTEKSGKEEPYQGILVHKIDDLTAWKEDATVILAVKPAFRREMLMNLLHLGFKDIKEWPDSEYVLRDQYAPKIHHWETKPEKGYVFPYDKVERESRIVIYGDGDMAESFYKQMEITGYADVVKWVAPEALGYDGLLPIEQSDAINDDLFDYVLVAYEERLKAKEAGWKLLSQGILPEKLIWTAGKFNIAKKNVRRNEEIVRSELEDYFGTLQEKMRHKKESIRGLVQGDRKILPKVVLNAMQGIRQAMADFTSILEKIDVCINLRIYMGRDITEGSASEIATYIPKDSKVLNKKIVVVDPVEISEETCRIIASVDAGVVMIYTDYSLFQEREAILNNLGEHNVSNECYFDFGEDISSKKQADAILVSMGEIYGCVEECIYRKQFNTEMAEHKSNIEEFSVEKVLKEAEA